jgi:hypothetical protein
MAVDRILSLFMADFLWGVVCGVGPPPPPPPPPPVALAKIFFSRVSIFQNI